MVQCTGVNNVMPDSLSRPANTPANVPATLACNLATSDQLELLSPLPTPLNYAKITPAERISHHIRHTGHVFQRGHNFCYVHQLPLLANHP